MEDNNQVEESQEEVLDAPPPKLVIDQAYIENRPLSYSSLKQFRKSPKHFIKYLTEPGKGSDAMSLGSLIDCLALTPAKFEKRFKVIGEKPNLRTNAGKAEWAKILTEASEGKQTLVTNEQMKTAKYCVESLMDTPESRRLIEGRSATQVSLEWRDKTNNLPMVGYVDFESKAYEEDWIVDLKSTKDADPDEVRKSIFSDDLQYYLQGGCYLEGYHRAKFRFPYFVNLFIETVSPYNVSVNYYDKKMTELAVSEFTGTLQAFRYCMDNQLFHQGYEFRLPESMNYFTITKPGWWKPRYGDKDLK